MNMIWIRPSIKTVSTSDLQENQTIIGIDHHFFSCYSFLITCVKFTEQNIFLKGFWNRLKPDPGLTFFNLRIRIRIRPKQPDPDLPGVCSVRRSSQMYE